MMRCYHSVVRGYGMNVYLCHTHHIYSIIHPIIQNGPSSENYKRMKTRRGEYLLKKFSVRVGSNMSRILFGVCDLSTVSLCIGILIYNRSN